MRVRVRACVRACVRVCVRDLMKGEQSEIVGGGELLRSGADEQGWNGVGIVGPTIQRTEGRPDQCEQDE